jgi:hypothetical protein
MKNIFLFFILFCLNFIPLETVAQIKSDDLKDFQLTKEEYSEFKNFLLSKNLKVKDTIFIKYDFNNEKCWDQLDLQGKKHINKIVSNFKAHISYFNTRFETAVAYNFREPGKRFNKLKLWDETIIIDSDKILKKLIFKDKVECGTSAVILADGSYLIYEKDPHFELLSLHHNYSGNKF